MKIKLGNKNLIVKIIKILTGVMLLGALMMLVSLYVRHRLLDIVVSFVPQGLLLIGALLLFFLALMVRLIFIEGWRACLKNFNKYDRTVLGIVLVFSSYILALSLTSAPSVQWVGETQEKTIKVMQFNKLYTNQDSAAVVNHMKNQKPDIIALEEILPGEVDVIRDSLGYKYSIVSDCDCSAFETEIALVSKFPIIDVTAIEDENFGITSATVDIGEGKIIRVYVVHIPPPISTKAYEARNKAWDALPILISSFEEPQIIMGDFNTTVYSPVMREFFEDTKQTGLQFVSDRAWPKCSWDMYSKLLCVRIDHIFLGKEFKLQKINISGDIGSDHHAITATITTP